MFWKIKLREMFGGQGSGNFGHEGRPGEVGGSGEGNGDSTTRSAYDWGNHYKAAFDKSESVLSGTWKKAEDWKRKGEWDTILPDGKKATLTLASITNYEKIGRLRNPSGTTFYRVAELYIEGENSMSSRTVQLYSRAFKGESGGEARASSAERSIKTRLSKSFGIPEDEIIFAVPYRS